MLRVPAKEAPVSSPTGPKNVQKRPFKVFGYIRSCLMFSRFRGQGFEFEDLAAKIACFEKTLADRVSLQAAGFWYALVLPTVL